MKTGNLKSQASAEFLIMLSLLLIIAAVVISASGSRNAQIDSLRASLYASTEAERLSSGINHVYLGGDGTSMHMLFPSSLRDGTPYSLIIYPSSRAVAVNYSANGNERAYSSPIMTSNVTSNAGSISGSITIKNSNGVVIIES